MLLGIFRPTVAAFFATNRLVVLFATAFMIFAAQPNTAAASNSCEILFKPSSTHLQREIKKTAIEFEGRSIYYEAVRAEKGRATVVVFSGLFTPISDLYAFQKTFLESSRGEGLILLTYSTSIESLIFQAIKNQAKKKTDEQTALDLSDFAREATAVMNAEAVSGPVVVVGYSYGSAPAARFASFHQGSVRDLIFAAPLVYPGDHAPQLVLLKEIAESAARLSPFAGPFGGGLAGSRLIEQMRSSAAKQMAQKIVSDYVARTKVPAVVKTDVLSDALAAQIRATEEFDLRKEDLSLWPRSHFLLAGKETPSRLEAQSEVVKGLKAQGERLGLVETVPGGEHPILAAEPGFSAQMVLEVARRSRARTP